MIEKIFDKTMDGINNGIKEALDIHVNEGFYELHRLNEMATLSRPYDNIPKNTKITVYGEGDENDTKTPHFHVIINEGEREFEIAFKHIDEMCILRVKGNHNKIWDGDTDVRKRLVEWIYETPDRNMGLTNLQKMVLAWNDANPTNEIDMEYCK